MALRLPAYGNANEWGHRARREYRVDTKPEVGAIKLGRQKIWARGLGIKCIRTRLKSKSITIIEKKYNRRNKASSMTGFIYFKDFIY